MSAELGRKRVSQTDPLQQTPQGRALCCLGTAEALFRRGSRGLRIAAVGIFTRRCAMPEHSQFNIDRTCPGLWTITFSNPPINMFVPSTIVELGVLMTDLEADLSLKVVAFQSANPDFSSPIST